jgi:hypothetical protein
MLYGPFSNLNFENCYNSFFFKKKKNISFNIFLLNNKNVKRAVTKYFYSVLWIKHNSDWTAKRRRWQIMNKPSTNNTTITMSFSNFSTNNFYSLSVLRRLTNTLHI